MQKHTLFITKKNFISNSVNFEVDSKLGYSGIQNAHVSISDSLPPSREHLDTPFPLSHAHVIHGRLQSALEHKYMRDVHKPQTKDTDRKRLHDCLLPGE